MSMNDHINCFEHLVYEVNYNKPTDTPNMRESVVNLKFLNTLMTDASSFGKWETFINAKGPNLELMSTQQLYAEVRVNAARIKSASTNNDLSTEAKALSTDLQQVLNAFNTRFDGFERNNKFRNQSRGNKSKSGYRSQSQSQNGGKKPKNGQRNQRSSKRFKQPYDSDKYCEWHGSRGHNTNECRAAKREATNQQATPSDSTKSTYQPNFNRSFSVNTTRLIVHTMKTDHTSDPRSWIIDSAANAYITPFKEKLHDYREFTDRVEVKGFAGKIQTAKGSGSITLIDAIGKRITLKDVVYVPESPDQILSLMKLRRERKAGFRFTTIEEFAITFPNGALLPGKSVDDICYIWTNSLNSVNTVVALKRKSPSESIDDNNDAPLSCSPQDLWHLRFGHASSTTLRKHPHIKSSFDSTHCNICIRAKQTRKPFHQSESKVKRKLERIHSDLCGPYPTSKGKSIYILTFLDEFTHWCWTATIPDKSSSTICQEFRYLIKQIETETDLKIKYLRTDGGGEYQGELTPVLKELGIKHEPTSPHSPQSNGKAERLNRTLNNYARAMLYQANMPESFWAEAITTATYILNRLPSDAIDAIPYELWHAKPLSTNDLKSIKPFGCIVHAHVPKKRRPRRSKMQPRSTKGCFIGYTETTSIFKIWDFERKCFVNTHDLIFEETQFPKLSDFDEPPANAQILGPSSTRESTPESTSELANGPQIFDEIVVQPPPALQAFKTYGEFQPDNDPPSFSDAMRRPDAKLWWNAFCDEIKSIIKRKAWILANLPPGKKALPLRWVCRIKRDATNAFERYKARIVVKGYAQEAELDFNETFAPVVRIDSVRTIFAIAAGKDLYIVQADIKSAFLHSKSDFQIYVKQPEGFTDVNHPHAVLLLNKALYGLKQAPRLWYLLLSEVIISLGFQVFETDTSIYIRDQILLAVYVDDILTVGPSIQSCNAIVKELSRHIEIVNKGEVKSFLGLRILRNFDQHALSISQPGYIDRLLAKYNMTNAKSASTPFETGTKLKYATENDKLCDVK